jgi:hypothetical protein
VKEIQEIVQTATDPVGSLQLRHEAFSDLVIRFQDMALAVPLPCWVMRAWLKTRRRKHS